MLTACFDAAPKESKQYKVLVVAGFASFAGIWKEFEERWTARLEQDCLDYFHAGEFAHSIGEFRNGWKENEPRRIALAGDLMEIIETCGLRKFGCAFRLDDFRNTQKRIEKKTGVRTMDSFAFAGMSSVQDFHAYASGERIVGNLRYVFEKGDPEDALRRCFRSYGFSEPDFAWSKPHTDRKGFSHDPFLGLQAAGWIAYEYYLDFDRLLYGERITDRWALNKFEKIPGGLTIKSSGSLLPDIEAMNRGFVKSAARIIESVDRLEAIRKKRVYEEETGNIFT
ncbi:MAG TPA: hypothetical protein VJ521_08270 [Acidobacteriota bacterium]|nr:hypothetical protein [Acidobacteriota bacterium]